MNYNTNDIIVKLKKAENKLSFLSPIDNHSYNFKSVFSAYRDLLCCVRKLRSIILDCKPTDYSSYNLTKEEFLSIDNPVDIKISKTNYDNYFAYDIDIPVIIPKSKNQIDIKLWYTSFQTAIREYKNSNNCEISLISNPVIIFENLFRYKSKGNGVKDTDNYSITELLNILQGLFIEDDRNATTVIRNIYNSSKNQTHILIVPDDKIIDYLLNNY